MVSDIGTNFHDFLPYTRDKRNNTSMLNVICTVSTPLTSAALREPQNRTAVEIHQHWYRTSRDKGTKTADVHGTHNALYKGTGLPGIRGLRQRTYMGHNTHYTKVQDYQG